MKAFPVVSVNFFVFVLMFVISSLVLCSCALADTNEKEVSNVLDKLHVAASKADGPTYFSLYADNAVFFGTDKSERWPMSEFKPYTLKRFASGKGWTYKATERNIFFSGDKKTAWFDERLQHAAGEARGTGVLVLDGKNWKIVQYNLNFPVPNDLFDPIYMMIKAYEDKK